jgi:hypothetical protein
VTRSLVSLLMQMRSRSGPSDPRLLAFARGLALGALVGAAIAGSRMWSRRGPGQPDP